MSTDEISCAESAARMADGTAREALPGKLNRAEAPGRLSLEVVAGREMLQRLEARAFVPIMSVLHRAFEAAGQNGGRYIEARHIREAIGSLKPLRLDAAEEWRWLTNSTHRCAQQEREASKDDDLARYLWWLMLYELQCDESTLAAGCSVTLREVWQLEANKLRERDNKFPGRAGSARKVEPR